MNCGLLEQLAQATLAERAMAQKLLTEHEMGELFKVIAFAVPGAHAPWDALGFIAGDRTHTL
jgi:SAM-dependent MidA family methyltransferase